MLGWYLSRILSSLYIGIREIDAGNRLTHSRLSSLDANSNGLSGMAIFKFSHFLHNKNLMICVIAIFNILHVLPRRGYTNRKLAFAFFIGYTTIKFVSYNITLSHSVCTKSRNQCILNRICYQI